MQRSILAVARNTLRILKVSLLLRLTLILAMVVVGVGVINIATPTSVSAAIAQRGTATTSSTTTVNTIAQRGTATTATVTNNASLVIAKPTGVVQGDLLIANLVQCNSTTAPTAPAGWTSINNVAIGTGRGAAFYKVAGGSEGANYTFTVPMGATVTATGGIVAFSGVDTVDPLDVAAATRVDTVAPYTVATAAITTVTNNAAIVMLGEAATSAATWSGWGTTSPATLNEVLDFQGTNTTVGAAWATKATAGSTGPSAATLSATQANNAILLALRPMASLTIAKPTGVVEGDLLIANLVQVESLTPPTAPSGWTLIDQRSLAGTTERYASVFYKVAGASEGASYTFTVPFRGPTAAVTAIGGIVAFSGIDSTTPFDVSPGTIQLSGAGSTTATAAGITTVTNNAVIVMLAQAAASAPTWSGWTTTSPGALGEALDFQGTNTSVGAAWASKATTGFTGNGTANLSAGERNGAILLGLRPAVTPINQRGTATTGTTTGTSLTISKPSGVVAGDVLLANIAVYGDNTTAPSSAGWTLVQGADLGGATARYGAVLYKVASSSEPASYTFTLGVGTTNAIGTIVAFSGVDVSGATPFDAVGAIVTGAGGVVTTTQITTASANAAVIMFGEVSGTARAWSAWTTTSPGTLTELYDSPTTSAEVGAAWGTKPAAGVTGAGGAALSGGGDQHGAILVALKPFTTHPVPTLTSISPNTKNVGDPGFPLTVIGTNFDGASVVRFNGSDRTTSFDNSTQLTATIPASDLLVAGTDNITVFNPAPGGGTSVIRTLTVSAVSNPIPTTTGISPTTKNVNDPGFSLTVTGTNFISASVVRFNGANRTTTFDNSTQLRADIMAGDLLVAGTDNITVFNPAPGGGLSGIQTLTVSGAVGLGGAATYVSLHALSITNGCSLDIGAIPLYVDGDVESTLDGWISDGRLLSSDWGASIDAAYVSGLGRTEVTPEPATLSLLAAGVLAMLRRRK